MENYLLVLAGKHKGRRIKLPTTQFLIGRDPRCHLRPASPDVSRHHCAIASRGAVVQVRDLKSENGTFINGEPVAGTVRVVDGDTLKVGALTFKFLLNHRAAKENLSDSNYVWLMRDPDEQEDKALDPANDTSILPSVLTGDEEDSDKRLSAVAGEYFRDTISHRRRRRR